MMSEIEKNILAMRQMGRKQEHKSIYDQQYTMVGETRYVFDWQTVVHKRIHIMLPTGFKDLPLKIAKLRYPSESRPKDIKSSLDTTINFAFLYGERIPDEAQIVNTARMYAAAIHKLNPGHQFLKSGTLYRDEKQTRLLSWYEYLSPTLEENLYNRHGFMIVEGKLMQIIFNCPEALAEEWKPVTLEVFLSVYGDLDHQLG